MINKIIQPLADRMRPRDFSEFFGQEEIVGKGKLLRKLIENDELSSIIFWGPPGVGKTTLAQIIAEATKSNKDIIKIITQALKDKERGLGQYKVTIKDEVKKLLASLAGGDARTALNGLELAVKSKAKTPPVAHTSPSASPNRGGISGAIKIESDDIKEALQRTHLVFDKNGEEFYNLISALHKSMRGSDVNASLYWLARMLEGGADPLYIARRVLRFASEDIGMANSEAMVQANTAYDACHKIGYPECSVHLAQAVIYCAKSKKSNLLYRAYEEATMDARNTSHLGVPIHLRNAPTKFMKSIGYGKDYKYNPDINGEVEQDYLPKELKNKDYFSKALTRLAEYVKDTKKIYKK